MQRSAFSCAESNAGDGPGSVTEGSVRARIERLGRRGEGVAMPDGARVYVPYTLPGETVSLHREGERGTLLGVVEPSPERIEPFCPYFGICGGCALQHWAQPPYAAWKRGVLVEALARAGLSAPVAPLQEAHGADNADAFNTAFTISVSFSSNPVPVSIKKQKGPPVQTNKRGHLQLTRVHTSTRISMELTDVTVLF